MISLYRLRNLNNLVLNVFKRKKIKYYSNINIKENNKLNNIHEIHNIILNFYKNINGRAFPIQNIRNFGIIAHIDHGKSTLADRLLEQSGNISEKERMNSLHLDTLQVEKDRGITVKAQSASMLYKDINNNNNKYYLLNLVDTPGHVDFSYEVNRSLKACEGVLLLVDSTQGIQAQTLATYELAKEKNLSIIPVITKIDSPNSQIEECTLHLASLLNVDIDDIILTSAKTGEGINDIFPAIINKIHPPIDTNNNNLVTDDTLRVLLIDSNFDDYRGVVCIVKVVNGTLNIGNKIQSYHSKKIYEIQEVGLLLPDRFKVPRLESGQVGYIICGMKTPLEAKIGDTLYLRNTEVDPFPLIKEAKSMVYASMYPCDDTSFEDLRKSLEKLLLTDSSVSIVQESNLALGQGFRAGFLGILHMEVFNQRLSQEQGASVLMTAPMVPYTIIFPDGTIKKIESPAEFPDVVKYTNKQNINKKKSNLRILEPMIEATILAPTEYLGSVLALLNNKRGKQTSLTYLNNQSMVAADKNDIVLKYHLPWQEIVCSFYDELKTVTSGYGTFSYTIKEPEESDIVKVNILINGKIIDVLSFLSHHSKYLESGKKIISILKEKIRRQQYEINIQATLGNKIFAKERISAYRKDVLTKSGKVVGGGDMTRKQKLLKKQKEGKKKLKTIANVPLSQDAFWSILSK